MKDTKKTGSVPTWIYEGDGALVRAGELVFKTFTNERTLMVLSMSTHFAYRDDLGLKLKAFSP